MDAITELFNTILKISFWGVAILLLTKFIRVKKNSSAKAEIQNLQAKLSQLRLSLKGKVQKKSKIFRSSFKSAINEKDMIDNALKELVVNTFESSDDFQAYFDLSRKIVSFITIENGEGANPMASLENNFMCSDFKTEMDIVRIIKEMTDVSSKINNRIEDNNRINPSQPIAKIDSLIFASMIEINRIFKEESHNATFNTPIATTPEDSTKKAS